ncbi:neuromedin-U [Anabas testudineus]|uniref:Neuromedin U C-terminal domain-containing protein n=1 Tax=Anabas testudineus TaxID=64144 RepID=A0A3Q1IRC5_ANATE|nr:neuromedin-U [Anabas testudineus]
MRTIRSQSQPAQRGAPSSLHSLSSSAMSPLSTASITLAALLILTIPVCKSGPTELQQVTRDQRQLISQIDAVCSSYLSADLKFWASDVLGELCVLMLVEKSKELKVQENTKRTPVSHPLLHLVSQLHTRRERGLSARAELQGPGGIQSRGYFLYRPRNGRRSLEYE